MTQLNANPTGATTSGKRNEERTLITMYENLSTQTQKAQGTEIVYILPNPARLHKPLLGIKRVDNQWICLFYLSAWDLLPERYNPNKSKKQNREAITKLCSKFYAIAKKSGVTIGRGAKVTSLLQSVQSLGAVNLLGYERAETLLAALHYLQFAGGEK